MVDFVQWGSPFWGLGLEGDRNEADSRHGDGGFKALRLEGLRLQVCCG